MSNLHRRRRAALNQETTDHKSGSVASRRKNFLPTGVDVVVGIVLLFGISASIAYYLYEWLPEPKQMDASANEFSEARARDTLLGLLEFDVRIVGSKANEVQTPQLLLKKIDEIKQKASEDVKIDIDIQHPSGAFGLNFLSQFQNIYANITNILVRVTPLNVPKEDLNNSLLISSHYDAAVGSKGASDDGISIAVMMELLRILSVDPFTRIPIIFNFNGAEETILQASHGFITQHPWKDSIRAFINLEAAGAGGRELLFQTGSDVLSMAYARGAVYPHASSLAKEVFQSGIIPSDTDFRIYRDYGDIPGMDFAYIANGYVYHTKLDDIDKIQSGAVQRFGDNLLGTLKELTSDPAIIKSIESHSSSSDHVSFDVLGMFMVSFPSYLGSLGSAVVVFIGIIYLQKVSPLSWSEKALGLMYNLKISMVTMCACIITSVFLSIYLPMAWYAQPAYALLVFAFPGLLGYVIMLDRIKNEMVNDIRSTGVLSIWKLDQMLFEAFMLSWMLLTMIAVLFGSDSSYSFALWVILPLLGHSAARLSTNQPWYRPSLYLAIKFSLIFFCVIHSMQQMAIGIQFFIPLMGRTGTIVPSDTILSVFLCLFMQICISYSFSSLCFVPKLTLTRVKKLLIFGFAITIISLALSNRYSPDRPKRVFIQHISRVFKTSEGQFTDSGIWVHSLDFAGLSPLKPYFSSTKWKNSLNPPTPQSYELDIYGNFPWYLPMRSMLPIKNTWYLRADIPRPQMNTSLTVVSDRYDQSRDRRRLHLRLSGPPLMTLTVDATKTRLTEWSIGNGTDAVPPLVNDCYFLRFATGNPPGEFHFWIEAETNNPITLAFAGFYVDMETNELNEVTQVLPDWADIIGGVSTYESWRI